MIRLYHVERVLYYSQVGQIVIVESHWG